MHAGKVVRLQQKLADVTGAGRGLQEKKRGTVDGAKSACLQYSSLLMHAGKVVRLRQKLADVTGAVTGLFGRKAEKDPAVARLDSLKVSSIGEHAVSAEHKSASSCFDVHTHFGGVGREHTPKVIL